MLDIPKRDRRAERRAATRTEILEAAWDLCRAEGLAGLSLRDLAARVGMQAPSLYSYFSSKNDIFDAMYAQGCEEFVETRPTRTQLGDALCGVTLLLGIFVRFCTEDPVRYQLMFQRTIPGFEPSAESFAVSSAGLKEIAAWMAEAGLDTPGALDLFTALGTGLADQQISNDPGGDRWTRLVDEAAEMYVVHVQSTKAKTTNRRGRR